MPQPDRRLWGQGSFSWWGWWSRWHCSWSCHHSPPSAACQNRGPEAREVQPTKAFFELIFGWIFSLNQIWSQAQRRDWSFPFLFELKFVDILIQSMISKDTFFLVLYYLILSQVLPIAQRHHIVISSKMNSLISLEPKPSTVKVHSSPLQTWNYLLWKRGLCTIAWINSLNP